MVNKLRPLTFASLKEAGFKLSATWAKGRDGTISLVGMMPDKPGLYLFVDGDLVCYIGVTGNSLRNCMKPYARRLQRGTPGRPVYKGIEAVLASGREVQIHTLTTVEPRWGEWNGLPFDFLVGLEASLIASFRPQWNTLQPEGQARDAEIELPT